MTVPSGRSELRPTMDVRMAEPAGLDSRDSGFEEGDAS